MESSSWPESLPSNRINAIQKLTQGKQLTNKLREMLGQPHMIESDLMSADGVVEEILGMFDSTLSILSSSSFIEIPQNRTHDDMRSPSRWDDQKSQDSGESIKTVVTVKTKRGCYKRSKTSSAFTKVTSNLIDDGYAWRKYGQKAILNAKHQRSYYRCSHKIEQGCKATKQVQKTDDEPPKYKITYNGHHACKNLLRAPQIIADSPNSRNNLTLLNFETNTLTKNDKQVGPCFPSMENAPKEGFSSLGLKHETNTLTENKGVGPCFPSMKHAPKEVCSSLGLKQEQVSPIDQYIPWYLVSRQAPSEYKSMMSSGLDQEDIVVSPGVFSSTCSTHGYAIDDMLGSNDFCDFPFELCP